MREKRRGDLRQCLQAAMASLSDEDVLILRLRFRNGLTAGRIAESLGLEAKPLYRRIDRLLLELRAALSRQGFDAAEAAELTEHSLGDEESEGLW
jgi:RNA polymerase sigma factor for flagellar operon FliA